MGHQDRGASIGIGGGVQPMNKRRDVMAINFNRSPTKRGPFVPQRSECRHFVTPSRRLPFVVIDHHRQLVQLLSRCKQGTFPNRSFIAFAITHEDTNSIVAALNPRRQSQADAHRQTVA